MNGRVPPAVERTIRRRGLLKGGEKIVVAVSGGADSMALLYALVALRPRWSLDLHVAHFDHRLRAASAEDAAFVSSVARDLGLAATIGSTDPTATPGLSPEEAARERRLRFLSDVADAQGADAIATGHTLDDQAETVLMRVLLGTGIAGLGGIPPQRDRYIRPLIDRRREETVAYCRELGLEPREDESNADTRFLRNLIRADVMPQLADSVNARLPEALARLADTAREDDAFLDSLADDVAEADPDGVRIDVARLRELPAALRRRVVRIALGGPHALAHVDAILTLALDGRSGDVIDLPGGLKASLGYGSLLLGRAHLASPLQPVELNIPGRTDLPSWGTAMTAWIDRQSPARWPDGKGIAVIDADAVAGPLIVRPRGRGDRMVPLGMTGSRTIADILAEAKLPRHQRDRVPIVATPGEVVWVPGHRVGDRFKVTERTERHLWLAFEGGEPWRS